MEKEPQAAGKNGENTNGELPPLLEQFLDARTLDDRLRILTSSKFRMEMDERLLDTIAAAMDLEIGEGSLEVRYEELLSCLRIKERYERPRR